MMKNMGWACALLLASCGPHSAAVDYAISGSDTTFTDGRFVYLWSDAAGGTGILDSALVRNHTFTLRGRNPWPVSAYLYLGRGADAVQIGDRDFIVESGTISVHREADGSFRFSGTPQNDLYNALPGRLSALTEHSRSALAAARSRDSLLRAVAMSNRSALGITLLGELLERHPAAEVTELLDAYPASCAGHPALQSLRRRIAALRTDIGRPFVDLSGITPSGDTLSLAEVVHRPGLRYVLLDFGALWCAPCRMEYPELVALRERFSDRGFEIFGVSFDLNAARWQECRTRFGLSWPQVHAGLGMAPRTTPAWRVYSLDYIPSTFLIDCSDGRIVAKQLHGVELAEMLGTLFARTRVTGCGI